MHRAWSVGRKKYTTAVVSGNHGKQLQIVKFKIIRSSEFYVFPVISTVKIKPTSKGAYE
jgi:hypothetical protein